MFANRNFAVSVLLAAALGAGTVTGVAGCGGSSPAAPPVTTSAAPPTPSATPTTAKSKQPKVSQAELQSVVNCMKSHDVTFTDARVTAKEIKNAFRALPVARQQSVFAACGSTLPASVRQVVQQRIAAETAAASASP